MTIPIRVKPPIRGINHADPQSKGLVLAMPFWEGSGDPYDYSGNGHHGTRKGDPYWTSGRFGQAMEFDGNGNFVTVSDDASIDFTSTENFSFGLWFKTSHDFAANKGVMLSKNQGSTHNNYFVEIQTDNALRAQAGDSELTVDVSYPKVNDGVWHHTFATVDASAGSLVIYLDGEKLGSDLGTYSGSENNKPLRIGRNGNNNVDLFFYGQIDDVRIYNRALTVSEVKDIYEYPFRLYRHDDMTPFIAGATLSDDSNDSNDTTAPTLTNVSVTATDSATVDGSINTDEGNGTVFWVITRSSTQPTKSQIINGKDKNDDDAAQSGNTTVTSTGEVTVTADNLTTVIEYYFHFVQEDNSGNQSNILSSNKFETQLCEDKISVLPDNFNKHLIHNYGEAFEFNAWSNYNEAVKAYEQFQKGAREGFFNDCAIPDFPDPKYFQNLDK